MKKILYVQFTNPGMYPPLQHSARLLADQGWRVRFVGVQNSAMTDLTVAPHANIDVRMLASTPRGFRRKLKHRFFIAWAFLHALFLRPRWVYASDNMSAIPALLMKWCLRRKVIYHEHDSYGGRARGLLIRCADVFVVPNEARRQIRSRGETLVVWNCPRRDEILKRPREPKTSVGLRLLYQGSFSEDLLPLTLLEAVGNLPSVTLDVIAVIPESEAAFLPVFLARVKALHLTERVRLHPSLPRRELLVRTPQFDVGISLMPLRPENPNLKFMTGASGKAFDYLAQGLPLLVSDLEDWRKFYVEPGLAIACNPEDPGSLAAAIGWFLDHSEELRAMGERGRQRCLAEWNYETQFQPVAIRLSGSETSP